MIGDRSVNSPCVRKQLEARRNKRLGVFVPRCRPDGGYKEVQCHGSVCFCTDEDGEEITGTRVPRHHTLNCSRASRQTLGKETEHTHYYRMGMQILFCCSIEQLRIIPLYAKEKKSLSTYFILMTRISLNV